MKEKKNLAASVRDRLLNHARETKDELQLVLMHYGLERLLYRLSQSDYAGEFVVKGAMLFLVWTGRGAPVHERPRPAGAQVGLDRASRNRFSRGVETGRRG